jgi:hypothetical protein
MKKFEGILFLLLLLSLLGRAQHQELSEKPNIWQQNQKSSIDSNTILSAFRKGSMKGHFRYFFSATDNAQGLTDYFANAGGGGLRFETAKYKGFQFGISGFYIFNLGSSDLSIPDANTNQFNRYELGLFDVQDSKNKNQIDRLEELYLKYSFKKTSIEFGKILINTPLINLQDGRMRPTGVEGLWIETSDLHQLKIEGGFLFAFSPRSTTDWYRGGESIGVYSSGVNSKGQKSDYAGNVESKGVGVLGLKYNPTTEIKLQLWEYYIENVLNTGLLQIDYEKETKNKATLIGSLQAIQQNTLQNGGNEDPSKQYADKNGSAFTFGARIGIKNQQQDLSLNYNRITNTGRYLFPREWGRDPFFTFMPRERNEGLGNAHAAVIKYARSFPKQKLKTGIAVGYYWLPDVQDFRNNKYGMPSYAQVNADVRYNFGGILNGLEAQLLLVGKFNQGKVYGNARYIFNKVNMQLYNLILNYRF